MDGVRVWGWMILWKFLRMGSIIRNMQVCTSATISHIFLHFSPKIDNDCYYCIHIPFAMI